MKMLKVVALLAILAVLPVAVNAQLVVTGLYDGPLDGWAYRSNMTGPDGDVFNLDNWFFSGPNAWDGELTNDTAMVPMPIGTYQIDPAVSTETTSWGNIKAMFDN